MSTVPPRPAPAPRRDPTSAAKAVATATPKEVAAEPDKEQKDDWVPVLHDASGMVYWWNKRTGETTALGEPKPGKLGRFNPVITGASSLGSMVAVGAGIGIVFGLLKYVF